MVQMGWRIVNFISAYIWKNELRIARILSYKLMHLFNGRSNSTLVGVVEGKAISCYFNTTEYYAIIC